MFETINDVPAPISQYYMEEVRTEPTGENTPEEYEYEAFDNEGNTFMTTGTRYIPEYHDVTYVVLKPFGEIQTNTANLLIKNAPRELVDKFLGFENNGIDKQFHDDYLEWFNSEVEYSSWVDEEGVESDNADAITQWQQSEPVRPPYKVLEDFPEYTDYRKLQGIEFEGVMCSATKADYWGLGVAFETIKAGLSTNWNFENGSTLLLTPDNIDAFKAVWLPFRMSFFDSNL